MIRAANLETLFNPKSVAIIGASEDRSKWGYWLSVGALRGRDHRRVTLVNRRAGSIEGVHFVPTLDGEAIDLAVISVPAAGFVVAVTAALAAGASALIGVTAGVPAADVAQALSLVRAAGASLLGPNCMGVASAADDLQLLWGDLPSGEIGLLSQSGNLAIELGMIARRAGLGFSRFASLGDARDLTAVDLLPAIAEGASAVAMYLEDVGDGRALVEKTQALVDSGTPVVLLTAGRSAAGAKAAASHTGALATGSSVLAAACRAAGAVLVNTPTELLEATRVSSAAKRGRRWQPVGPRIGIVGDGGGHGVIAADLAESVGLRTPTLSAALQERILAQLPPTASALNPIDLAGGGERDLDTYADVSRELATSGEVDAVVLTGYFGGYASDLGGEHAAREEAVADRIASIAAETGVPVVVHSMAADSATCERLRAGGVPTWFGIEHAVSALASRRPAPAAARVPAEPPIKAGRDPYWAARDLLGDAGVRFPRAIAASSQADVERAGADVGFPCVLKALGVAHKSDVGGVALRLATVDQLAAAHAGMAARLAPAWFSVEEMIAASGVEMIVGARHDPRFGPVVMAGLGGVLAEAFTDTAVELAAVSLEQAEAMVSRLRGIELLRGFRGSKPLDVTALADVIVAVSRVAAAHPEIAELDVNPVLVTEDGVVALDAHLVLR